MSFSITTQRTGSKVDARQFHCIYYLKYCTALKQFLFLGIIKITIYLPPYAWNTTDSFPVLMHPVMVSSNPELTILYRSRRVLGSTAFSYTRKKLSILLLTQDNYFANRCFLKFADWFK